MKIVADTNLLISSIFWNGSPYKIVQQALNQEIEIFISKYILDEVRKVLTDPKEKFRLSKKEIEDVIEGILLYAKIIEPKTTTDVVKRDKKDNPIIACALDAQANFIITRDKDLLTIKQHAGIKIITPEEFIK